MFGNTYKNQLTGARFVYMASVEGGITISERQPTRLPPLEKGTEIASLNPSAKSKAECGIDGDCDKGEGQALVERAKMLIMASKLLNAFIKGHAPDIERGKKYNLPLKSIFGQFCDIFKQNGFSIVLTSGGVGLQSIKYPDISFGLPNNLSQAMPFFLQELSSIAFRDQHEGQLINPIEEADYTNTQVERWEQAQKQTNPSVQVATSDY